MPKQRRRAGHWLVLVFGLALLAQAHDARAEAPARVVLFDRPDSDELGLELSARIRGELRAAGFEVVVLALPNDVGPERAAERVASELDPAAVVVLRKTGEPLAGDTVVELWIANRRPGRAQRERVELPEAASSAGVARFAVQIAELVKARLAELSVVAPEPRPEPPAVSAAPKRHAPEVEPIEPAQPSDEGDQRWVLGVAVGALADLSARDAALIPLLRAGVLFEGPTPTFDLELRVTLGAFGRDVSVADGPARAELDQSLGSVELGLRFETGVPLEPALFLGAGTYMLRAKGFAPEGYATRSERTWSALACAGGGLAYAPVRWLRWSVDAQLLAVTPAAVVRLAEHDQPEHGPWMGLVTTGIAGVF